MTLGSVSTRPRPNSPEFHLIALLRSGGFAIRYNEDDGVHRILAPSQNGNTIVGLIVIREQRIHYAEFDRRIFPWWGRSTSDPLYAEAFANLESDITEGRRK